MRRKGPADKTNVGSSAAGSHAAPADHCEQPARAHLPPPGRCQGAVALVALLCYCNHLGNGFAFDDLSAIVNVWSIALDLILSVANVRS